MTLEAFLARKPVITATDSGGPLEFVVDGVNGAVVAPEARALAMAINRLRGRPASRRPRTATAGGRAPGRSPGTA